jgi:hypothetical protein
MLTYRGRHITPEAVDCHCARSILVHSGVVVAALPAGASNSHRKTKGEHAWKPKAKIATIQGCHFLRELRIPSVKQKESMQTQSKNRDYPRLSYAQPIR